MKIFTIGVTFILLLGWGPLTAQVTITSESFPEVGDTLRYGIAANPQSVSITAAGGDQTWDFSMLQAAAPQTTIYEAASAGENAAEFPEADLVTTIGEFAENYYQVEEGQIRLQGFVGEDPIGFGLGILSRLSPPYVDRRAPQNFLDNNQAEANVLLPFSGDDLPSQLTDQLPFTPDSLRIRIAFDRLDLVDAWGTLSIPDGDFKVLREKRVEEIDTRVDAKLPFVGWLDVTDQLIDLLEIDELGARTVTTYHFFSPDEKETIATVTVNSETEEILTVQFKNENFITSVTDLEKARIKVYPNPVSRQLFLETPDLSPGTYQLMLFNGVGALSWKTQLHLDQGSRQIDLPELDAGVYYFSLRETNGGVVFAQPVIVK